MVNVNHLEHDAPNNELSGYILIDPAFSKDFKLYSPFCPVVCLVIV